MTIWNVLRIECFHLLPADFKGELRRLNRELLFTFLDLLDCLVQRPSTYARAVENVGLVARNMSYILNALRSEQAKPLPRTAVPWKLLHRIAACHRL